MRKRYWNRKVSALLMAGLVLSALPVHAFAEEEQKSVDVAAQAEQEVEEPMNVPVLGDDNAGGTQDGLVSAEETSELKGTEADSENQGGTGKEADSSGEKEQETGTETGKDADADTDMNTDKDADTDAEVGEGKETETEASSAEKSDAENLTEKSSASGTENSEEKAEAASDVKPEVEELAEEILPEELTLASASDIPMASAGTEIEASLLGTWTVDGYTSLVFYGDGNGAMLLPAESYDFHYTLNDDHLDLDFVSSRARDLSYTISFDADTLQLSSGTGTKTVAITLQRVE